jgi:hypothetical protein
MAIIAVVWALLLPACVRARNRAHETRCLEQLRSVSFALRMYSQDYHGQFPPEFPGLRALTPRYLHDDDVYRCPTTRDWELRWGPALKPEPPGSVDYAYHPGLAIDDRPQEAVAWDSAPRHHDRGNVLTLSGAVKPVRAAALADLNRSATAGRPGDAP